MMRERVIWSRRYLTNGVRSANVSLVPLRGHLSESVPAVYYVVAAFFIFCKEQPHITFILDKNMIKY